MRQDARRVCIWLPDCSGGGKKSEAASMSPFGPTYCRHWSSTTVVRGVLDQHPPFCFLHIQLIVTPDTPLHHRIWTTRRYQSPAILGRLMVFFGLERTCDHIWLLRTWRSTGVLTDTAHFLAPCVLGHLTCQGGPATVATL